MGSLVSTRRPISGPPALPVSALRPDLTREIINAAFYQGLCVWEGQLVTIQWLEDRKPGYVTVTGTITQCGAQGFVLQTDHWRTHVSWVDLWIGDKTIVTDAVRQQVDQIRQALITAGSPVIALDQWQQERQRTSAPPDAEQAVCEETR